MKTSIALTPSPLTRVPFLYAGRLGEGMRRAAELGYDAVELHLRDPAVEDMDAIAGELGRLGVGGRKVDLTEHGVIWESEDPQFVRVGQGGLVQRIRSTRRALTIRARLANGRVLGAVTVPAG